MNRSDASQLAISQLSIPHAPLGNDGFSIESMRLLAEEYGATSFVEQSATEQNEYSLLINPLYSIMQFGISSYDVGNGIVLTHSVASYHPFARTTTEANRFNSSEQAQNIGYIHIVTGYIDVIDITVPYNLPYVYVTSRIRYGATNAILSTNRPIFSKDKLVRVELESNFNEFIDVYAVPDQEVTAFIDLAPNIMETLLTHFTNFTIEFINNHIYIYFLPSKYQITPPANTEITNQTHRKILEIGHEIGKKLAIGARPSSTGSHQTMPHLRISDTKSSLASVIFPLVSPLLLLALLVVQIRTLFTLSQVLAPSTLPLLQLIAMTIPSALFTLPVIISLSRVLRERKRINNLHRYYGDNQIDLYDPSTYK